MEMAENVQLMLPGVGGKCSCDPICEQVLSVADDELLGGTAIAAEWLQSTFVQTSCSCTVCIC